MVKRRKPTIDDYVSAILDRDNDVPYPDVLERYVIATTEYREKFQEKNKNISIAELTLTLKM